MTKQILKVLQAILLAALTSALSACVTINGEPDEPEDIKAPSLPTPEFSAEAALFEIEDGASEFNSIELTESGEYIIKSQSLYQLSQRSIADVNVTYGFCNRYGFLHNRKSNISRASTNGVISGKYVKTGNREYRLDGFGTIKVLDGADGLVDLEITMTSGECVNVGARKREVYNSSPMTTSLCRTWSIDKFSLAYYINGKLMQQADFDMSDYKTMYEDWGIDIRTPERILFTQSGSYVVFYDDDTLAVSTWAWEDESVGKARYSWNYEYLYDPRYSGEITIGFSGNKLKITESVVDVDEYDGYTESTDITFYMSEVR